VFSYGACRCSGIEHGTDPVNLKRTAPCQRFGFFPVPPTSALSPYFGRSNPPLVSGAPGESSAAVLPRNGSSSIGDVKQPRMAGDYAPHTAAPSRGFPLSPLLFAGATIGKKCPSFFGRLSLLDDLPTEPHVRVVPPGSHRFE